MTEKDFETLAGFIADVVIRNVHTKAKVAELRENFLKMHYCLPTEQTAPLVARIFSSIFQNDGFFNSVVANLDSLLRK